MSEEQKPSEIPPVQVDYSQPPVYVKPQPSVNNLIPTSNPRALLAYYVAIFSLIPGCCLVLGPVAVVLGVVGLRAAKDNPQVGGKAHAWVGVILGGITTAAALIALVYILGQVG